MASLPSAVRRSRLTTSMSAQHCFRKLHMPRVLVSCRFTKRWRSVVHWTSSGRRPGPSTIDTAEIELLQGHVFRCNETVRPWRSEVSGATCRQMAAAPAGLRNELSLTPSCVLPRAENPCFSLCGPLGLAKTNKQTQPTAQIPPHGISEHHIYALVKQSSLSPSHIRSSPQWTALFVSSGCAVVQHGNIALQLISFQAIKKAETFFYKQSPQVVNHAANQRATTLRAAGLLHRAAAPTNEQMRPSGIGSYGHVILLVGEEGVSNGERPDDLLEFWA